MQSFKEFIGEDWLRYKRPSINNILGITDVKKEIRADTGLNTVARWTPNRIKQRLFQHIGIYGDNFLRPLRQLGGGKIKSPFRILPKIFKPPTKSKAVPAEAPPPLIKTKKIGVKNV